MQGRTVRLHDRDETIAVVNVSYHGNTLVIMENRGQGSNKNIPLFLVRVRTEFFTDTCKIKQSLRF